MNKKARKLLAAVLTASLTLSQFTVAFAGSAQSPTTSREKMLERIEAQLKGHTSEKSLESLLEKKQLLPEPLKKQKAAAQEATAAEESEKAKIQEELSEPLYTLDKTKTVPGRILVKYKEGLRADAVESMEMLEGVSEAAEVDSLNIMELNISKKQSLKEMIREIEKDPNVEYAEPVYKRSLLTENTGVDTSHCDDAYYADGWQWGLEAMHLDPLWEQTDAEALSEVVIAVVDTGVDTECPEVSGSLVDGYDFINDDDDADDDHGHGTHVAGIAAGVWDGEGIAGAAGGAKIMPVKVLSGEGYGDTVSVVNGILYAVNHGADIINMSLGGYGLSRAEQEAVQYAIDHGVVVVAAAGNEGMEGASYPAAFEGVITVGAADWDGSRFMLADFSNYGSEIDVAAPGVAILSSVPKELDNFNFIGDEAADGYAKLSGTSMATPFVAGMAALLLASDEVGLGKDDPGRCAAVQEAMQADAYEFESGSFTYSLVNGDSGAAEGPYHFKQLNLELEMTKSDTVEYAASSWDYYGGEPSGTFEGEADVYAMTVSFDGWSLDLGDPFKLGGVSVEDGISEKGTYTFEETGFYVLYASGGNGYMSSPATLVLAIEGGGDGDGGEVDSNISFETAEPLELGTELQRSLTDADQDYYAIDIEKAGYYTFKTTGSTDTVGHLYDADQEEISNGDDWDTFNFVISQYLEPGRYYVMAEGFGGHAMGDYGILAEEAKGLFGAVQLPEGKVAGPEGIPMDILVFDAKNGFFMGYMTTEIEAGESTAHYGIPMQFDTDLIIGYATADYGDAFPYVSLGYHAKDKTVVNIAEAAVLPGMDDLTGTDMQLLEKKKMSDREGGKATLGMPPVQSGIDYAFDADRMELSVDQSGDYMVTCEVPAGLVDQFAFEVLSPSGTAIPVLMSSAHFGEETVSFNQVLHLNAGSQYRLQATDMGYLNTIFFDAYEYSVKVAPYLPLKGELKLPETAPDGDYASAILAENADGQVYWIVTPINPTVAGTPFMMPVPAGTEYTVSYHSINDTSYATEGYYTENGTSYYRDQATSVGEDDLEGALDLSLIEVPDSEGDSGNPTLIHIGKPLAGRINSTDEDFYRFTVATAGDYEIDFGSAAVLSVYLYDHASGKWISYSETGSMFSGDDGDEPTYGNSLKRHLEPGVYDIKMAGIAFEGDYEFVINGAPYADAPQVAGTAKTGETLTGSYTYLEGSCGAESGTTYRWLVCATEEGTYAALDGATATTYVLSDAEIGKFIRFEVTPAAANGVVGETVRSEAFGPVKGDVEVVPMADKVAVTGSVKVGKTVSGKYAYTANGCGDEKGTTYKWLIADAANGIFKAIAGATGKDLALTEAMKGKYLKFEVTPKAENGKVGQPALSAPAGPVAAASSGGGGGGGGGNHGGDGNSTGVGNGPAANTVTPVITLPTDPTPLAAPFKDISGHWAKGHIDKLVSKGILGGYEDGTIRPDALITRAEAAKILVGAVGKPPLAGEPRTIMADGGNIPQWAKGYVGTALDDSIMTGYEDKTFRFDKNLTRAEMVVMIMRAFGLGQSSQPLAFSDQEAVKSWAEGYIAKAVELGLIGGYADNSFRPDQEVTRAEFFKVIALCLELKK